MSLNTPIKDWTNKRVWIIGASTGIGEALARQIAHRGARLCISARSKDKLDLLAKALPGTHASAVDITDAFALQQAASQLIAQWGGLDLVVIMAGTYSEMRAREFDLAKAMPQVAVNLHGVLNTLSAVLPQLVTQRSGHLSIVSSVAGYSGLPNSTIYGPTKAALINMAESLYVDLREDGVDISVINPGFVDTPLTQKNKFPMPFIVSADQAALEIIQGYAAGSFEIHFPKAFSRILKVLRLLPYWAYFPAVKRFTKV